MLVHAVRAMARFRAVSLVVVVAPPDGAEEVRWLLEATCCRRSADIVVVPGGETRQDSVRLGLAVLPDASTSCSCTTRPARRSYRSRPWTPCRAVRGGRPPWSRRCPWPTPSRRSRPRARRPEPVTQPRAGAAACRADPAGLRPVQVLAAAHAQVAEDGADDAGMVERLGIEVVVVPGHEEAFR